MEHQLNEIIEALLLSASRPVSIEEIEKVFVENPPSKEEIRNSLNEIEENCSDWQGCSTLEREVIAEMNQNATKGIIISVIMGSLAIFFWPENNQREW